VVFIESLSFHRVLHATLTERIIFNIRRAAAPELSATHPTTIPYSNIEFAVREGPDPQSIATESLRAEATAY
jgi:hypothetical protein